MLKLPPYLGSHPGPGWNPSLGQGPQMVGRLWVFQARVCYEGWGKVAVAPSLPNLA